MNHWRTTITVTDDKLQALAAFAKAEGLTFALTPIEPKVKPSPQLELPLAPVPAPATKRPPKKFNYVGGKRDKDISARDLVLEVLNTSEQPYVHADELAREFVKYSFANTSWQPAISALVKEGSVIRIGEGVYCAKNRYVKLP